LSKQKLPGDNLFTLQSAQWDEQ